MTNTEYTLHSIKKKKKKDIANEYFTMSLKWEGGVEVFFLVPLTIWAFSDKSATESSLSWDV